MIKFLPTIRFGFTEMLKGSLLSMRTRRTFRERSRVLGKNYIYAKKILLDRVCSPDNSMSGQTCSFFAFDNPNQDQRVIHALWTMCNLRYSFAKTTNLFTIWPFKLAKNPDSERSRVLGKTRYKHEMPKKWSTLARKVNKMYASAKSPKTIALPLHLKLSYLLWADTLLSQTIYLDSWWKVYNY